VKKGLNLHDFIQYRTPIKNLFASNPFSNFQGKTEPPHYDLPHTLHGKNAK
jgi:hypothetical protein